MNLIDDHNTREKGFLENYQIDKLLFWDKTIQQTTNNMADFFQSVVTLTASSRRRDTIEEINDLNLPACSSFEDMGLKDDLLRGILSNHYERPLALQQV